MVWKYWLRNEAGKIILNAKGRRLFILGGVNRILTFYEL